MFADSDGRVGPEARGHLHHDQGEQTHHALGNVVCRFFDRKMILGNVDLISGTHPEWRSGRWHGAEREGESRQAADRVRYPPSVINYLPTVYRIPPCSYLDLVLVHYPRDRYTGNDDDERYTVVGGEYGSALARWLGIDWYRMIHVRKASELVFQHLCFTKLN